MVDVKEMKEEVIDGVLAFQRVLQMREDVDFFKVAEMHLDEGVLVLDFQLKSSTLTEADVISLFEQHVDGFNGVKLDRR